MNFKPTYKTGGTKSRKPSKNDRAMVNGVSSILRKIKDKKNRKEVAGSMVKQFNREGVSYNKEKFLKNSRSYQYGGASRADSLDVLANSIAVQNYYSGRRYNPVSRTFGRNLGAFNILYDTRNYFNNWDRVTTPTGSVPRTAVNYYTPIDRNRFRQRETANFLLDTRAPMQLFDRRIEPTGNLLYRNREDNDPMYGDNVDIYTYDPLSVTPWDMLSTQQKKQRINKYGISGTPYKSKQEFIEKTSDPEVIRKQKLLKEAGLYKGAIDGDWGDKSEEAWKKYKERLKPMGIKAIPATLPFTPITSVNIPMRKEKPLPVVRHTTNYLEPDIIKHRNLDEGFYKEIREKLPQQPRKSNSKVVYQNYKKKGGTVKSKEAKLSKLYKTFKLRK